MTDIPNCSTCGYKDNDWCEKLNRIMNWSEISMVSEVGCIYNPNTRKYFMQGAIEELTRLKNEWSFSRIMRWERNNNAPIKIYQDVMEEAIFIIENLGLIRDETKR